MPYRVQREENATTVTLGQYLDKTSVPTRVDGEASKRDGVTWSSVPHRHLRLSPTQGAPIQARYNIARYLRRVGCVSTLNEQQESEVNTFT